MDTLHLGQHISHQFNDDLEHLRAKLLEMGGLVEDQLRDAIKAIEFADGGLAEKVMQTEPEVDQREMALDQEAITLLARRQPAASDLRLVMMVTKAIRDLERIGDEANKIAKMALELNQTSSDDARGFVELRHLASNVVRSVSSALDAFARYDVETAVDVMRNEQDIDREYRTAIREMMTYMIEDPRAITRVMSIMSGLRALERIGDHAGNIAEQVIYLVHGEDIRHSSIVDIQKVLDSKS